jgi:hypothetical protein
MKSGTHKLKKHSTKNRASTQKRAHFFFHPNNPSKSFDVYINKDPSNTIPIRYKTVEDVTHTIETLEHLYKTKQYPHKRIWQVGMIMKVRLGVLRQKKPKEYALANRYFRFLGNRTNLPEKERYRSAFSF